MALRINIQTKNGNNNYLSNYYNLNILIVTKYSETFLSAV